MVAGWTLTAATMIGRVAVIIAIVGLMLSPYITCNLYNLQFEPGVGHSLAMALCGVTTEAVRQ